jgi:hypothetical protein
LSMVIVTYAFSFSSSTGKTLTSVTSIFAPLALEYQMHLAR